LQRMQLKTIGRTEGFQPRRHIAEDVAYRARCLPARIAGNPGFLTIQFQQIDAVPATYFVFSLSSRSAQSASKAIE
jgi:hypothetical protein